MKDLEELVKRLEAVAARLEALLAPKPQPFGAGGPGDEQPPPKPQ